MTAIQLFIFALMNFFAERSCSESASLRSHIIHLPKKKTLIAAYSRDIPTACRKITHIEMCSAALRGCVYFRVGDAHFEWGIPNVNCPVRRYGLKISITNMLCFLRGVTEEMENHGFDVGFGFVHSTRGH